MAKKSFTESIPSDFFMTDTDKPYIGTPAAPAGYKPNRAFIETKSRRVQLLMQPSLYEQIKARAEKEYMSFNEYVHKILEESLQ